MMTIQLQLSEKFISGLKKTYHGQVPWSILLCLTYRNMLSRTEEAIVACRHSCSFPCLDTRAYRQDGKVDGWSHLTLKTCMTGARFIIREQAGYLLTFHTISRTQKILSQRTFIFPVSIHTDLL